MHNPMLFLSGKGAAAGLLRVSRLSYHLSQQISTLVVAEYVDQALAPSSLNTILAAEQLGVGQVTVLIAGHKVSQVAEEAARVKGVDAVLIADDDSLAHQLAERHAALLTSVISERQYSHVLASSSSHGKNLLPRAAAVLDVQPVSEVLRILSDDTFIRPIYAGNALQTIKCPVDSVKLLTIRASAFDRASIDRESLAPIEPVSKQAIDAVREADMGSEWLSEELSHSKRPELGSARVVVAGGRALKSAENFQLVEDLADALGGAVGASRAAVDAGMAGNDLQVGQTGRTVAPDLYIAVGISGAIQHLAGMKDSKCIVAINNNPDEPIFQVADYGLVADIFEALPALKEELKKQ